MNQQSKVAVVGAGIMGEALISALISSGVNPELITISEKRADRSAELIAKYSIRQAPLATNVAAADAVLLVVKPQDMAAVLEEIKGFINPAALVITFAAGKTISFISSALGTANPVIRVMPNTPTMVGAGMAAASMGVGVTDDHKKFVLGFLAATGKVIEVSEDLQDAVTATSGSGPAYFFAFVEAMVAGAKELGLSLPVMSLAWCLKNPNVSTVILGASKLHQLQENMQALGAQELLTPDVMQRIEDILQNKPEFPAF